jgi:hypothetical protein
MNILKANMDKYDLEELACALCGLDVEANN